VCMHITQSVRTLRQPVACDSGVVEVVGAAAAVHGPPLASHQTDFSLQGATGHVAKISQ